MFRKPFSREFAHQERELQDVLNKADKEEQKARKEHATEAQIRDIRGSWSMEIDMAHEELDSIRTRSAWRLAGKYDIEMPSSTEHPELWEERRYGYGHVLNTKGRAYVRELIRTEQKHGREQAEFWAKNVILPFAGWVVAIVVGSIAIIFKH